jgi:hypothetical protein
MSDLNANSLTTKLRYKASKLQRPKQRLGRSKEEVCIRNSVSTPTHDPLLFLNTAPLTGLFAAHSLQCSWWENIADQENKSYRQLLHNKVTASIKDHILLLKMMRTLSSSTFLKTIPIMYLVKGLRGFRV